MAITAEEFDHFELVLDDMLITHLIDTGRLQPGEGQTASAIRADILTESSRRFDELIESESARQGAELLHAFRQRVSVPFALVTCSETPQVDPYLDHYDLRKVFSLVLTGEDVIRKKHEPEIFHKALDFFAVQGEDTVAIEDAVRGVQGALSAGIPVVRPTAFLLVHESLTNAIEVPDLASALDLIAPLCIT